MPADSLNPPASTRWLTSLRWAFLVVELGAMIGFLPWVRWTLAAGLLSVQLALIIVPAGALKRGTLGWGRVTALLGADIAIFTGLLAMAGGASNPFTVVFLVYIAVAVATLPRRWAWSLVCLAVGGFAALFVGHDPHAHHDMSKHLYGMWIGFAGTAALTAWFGGRIHAELRARTDALMAAQTRAAWGEQLAALGALAASCAHELGTPLGSIAIAAEEMPAALEGGALEDVRADIALIQSEVQRCRAVLNRLANDAGEARGESQVRFDVHACLRDLIASEPEPERVQLEGASASVSGYPLALARIVRALLDNGRRAGPDDVIVRLHPTADGIEIQVRDTGRGMSSEILGRATEPFFSTRQTDGLGLGLYLAARIAEQLGGILLLESALGEGTVARLQLPWGVHD